MLLCAFVLHNSIKQIVDQTKKHYQAKELQGGLINCVQEPILVRSGLGDPHVGQVVLQARCGQCRPRGEVYDLRSEEVLHQGRPEIPRGDLSPVPGDGCPRPLRWRSCQLGLTPLLLGVRVHGIDLRHLQGLRNTSQNYQL